MPVPVPWPLPLVVVAAVLVGAAVLEGLERVVEGNCEA